MEERMRGRAGQAALKRRRSMYPTCAHCEARGIIRNTDEIDHIQPLSLGGKDTDDNCQGLCTVCHSIKTAFEGASLGGAANHPDWLRPAACRLTIVSGPPCAGKSTLVERERGGNDLVIDLDELAERISPGFLLHRRWTSELLNQCIRARNAMLGALSRMAPRAQAWLILSAPTEAERDWWRARLKPLVWRHLDPGKDACLRRAQSTEAYMIRRAAVVAWYERNREPWRPASPPVRRVGCDADGYPLTPQAGQ